MIRGGKKIKKVAYSICGLVQMVVAVAFIVIGVGLNNEITATAGVIFCVFGALNVMMDVS